MESWGVTIRRHGLVVEWIDPHVSTSKYHVVLNDTSPLFMVVLRAIIESAAGYGHWLWHALATYIYANRQWTHITRYDIDFNDGVVVQDDDGLVIAEKDGRLVCADRCVEQIRLAHYSWYVTTTGSGEGYEKLEFVEEGDGIHLHLA